MKNPYPQRPARFRHSRPAFPTALLALALLAATGCDGLGSASEADYLERADQYMERGDYAAAIIEYRNALREESRAPTRAGLGLAYHHHGQHDNAVSHLERAWHQQEQPDLVLPLARSLFHLNRLEEIEDLDPPAHLTDTEKAEFLSYQALGLVRAGDTESGHERLEQARSLDPGLAILHLTEAEKAFRDGDIEAAFTAVRAALDADEELGAAWSLKGDLKRVEGDVDAALAAYDRSVELRPDQITERLKRGFAHFHLENMEAAAADAEVLRTGAPGHPGGHFLQGMIHFHQDEYDQAQAYLEESLSAARNYRAAMPYLAAIHLENGNLTQAEHQLQRHRALGESTSMTYQLQARIHLERDETDHARRVLANALESRPELTPELGNLLAAVYLETGHTEQGEALLRTSIEEGHATPTMRRMLAQVLVERGEEDEAAAVRESTAGESGNTAEAEAMTHLGAGRYSRALELTREMIADAPDAAQGYNVKGAALLGLDRVEEARLTFQEGLQKVPDSISLAMNLGSLELRMGHRDAATEVFEELQRRQPGHPGSAMRLAGMALSDGRPEQAAEWLEPAIEQAPDQLQPRLIMARAQLAQDRPDAAVETLAQTLERHPEEPEALFAMADVQERRGAPEEAVDPMRRLTSLRPDNATFQFRLARVLAASGAPEESVVALREVLSLNPERMDARQALVRQLSLMGQVDEAREAFGPLEEAGPDLPAVKAQRAWFEARAGDHEAAAKSYSAAIEQQPRREWLAERHQVRMAAGQTEQALSELEEWLQRYPEDPGARHLLGSTLVELGEEESAISTYRVLLARHEDDVIALNNLAWLLRERDNEQALDHARRARDLAPDHSVVLDTLGVVLLYGDQPGEAREVLETAFDDAASTPDIGYNLARARDRAGDSTGARTLLEAILQEGGDFPERNEARALHDQLAR